MWAFFDSMLCYCSTAKNGLVMVGLSTKSRELINKAGKMLGRPKQLGFGGKGGQFGGMFKVLLYTQAWPQ
jgi:hypothetical protein